MVDPGGTGANFFEEPPPAESTEAKREWRFLTNHFAVLACVATSPNTRVRDIAQAAGITERATQAILSDLVEAGYVERTRVGRRNQYSVRHSERLRHPLFCAVTVGDLLSFVTEQARRATPSHP
jgi:predicted transcriptional regulator